MEKDQPDLLTENYSLATLRRRQLIPWWIKAFSWIFLVLGAVAPVGIIVALAGHSFQLQLYGITTNESLSPMGLGITSLFFFKGITAFCLLSEKDPAIQLATIDASVGIIICLVMTLLPLIVPGTGIAFVFRLELLLLIPYLRKMLMVKNAWQNKAPADMAGK